MKKKLTIAAIALVAVLCGCHNDPTPSNITSPCEKIGGTYYYKMYQINDTIIVALPDDSSERQPFVINLKNAK